jgi:hypothetical protein
VTVLEVTFIMAGAQALHDGWGEAGLVEDLPNPARFTLEPPPARIAGIATLLQRNTAK